jgi:hypothetical protein
MPGRWLGIPRKMPPDINHEADNLLVEWISRPLPYKVPDLGERKLGRDEIRKAAEVSKRDW